MHAYLATSQMPAQGQRRTAKQSTNHEKQSAEIKMSSYYAPRYRRLNEPWKKLLLEQVGWGVMRPGQAVLQGIGGLTDVPRVLFRM